ncbi:hypothetical protein J5N97_028048 [Dioscorea zingiberensis]|uniref:DUF4408 domain-containing protein n=1 Tax=Dioscorea zingiberensis TaxID=325984 RepID=A0A9D5H4J6_9LILI|nr:hypothetical protein J5N97_028048 [Dioscorea zingiberensis]
MDTVKVEKASAMWRYRWIRTVERLFHCLEACAANMIISWSSAKLPTAARLFGDLLRSAAAVLLSPRFVFLLGNAIVLVLFAKSENLSQSPTSMLDRATGEGAEAPADAVEDIANEDAAATNDSYIGDDFWDLEIEDDINVGDGGDNPRVIPSPTNATDTSFPGTTQSGPSRRVKRKRSFSQDGGTDEINSNISSMASWVESSGEHISRLASCFQFLSDDADAKKKVFGELLKIEGLTQSERIKVGAILVSDTSRVSYFFSLPDACKEEYARLVLDGCR